MKNLFRILTTTIVMVAFICLLPLQTLATDVSFLDGNVTIKDNANTGKNTNGTYTATAKGSLFSKKTNTITITNSSANKATIKFVYSVDKANSFTIAGASATSGEHSQLLDPGAGITLVLTSNSGLSDTTATLTLTNITHAVMHESVDITFEYNGDLGTVTADGVAVSNGDAVTIGEAGIQLVATPASSDVRFVAWVDESGKIIETASTYTQLPSVTGTIKALFSIDTPYFKDENNYIYDDLNEAASSGAKEIILVCDGVLPAKEEGYTIPSGVTLLIPSDNVNTMYTPDKGNLGVQGYTNPSVYRKLTMESGAKITVNGTINISANQSSSMGTVGLPTGKYGLITMQEGSTITVKNGGVLYAWGYITGSGSITAESGATVYENFQVMDWRGGSATTKMVDEFDSYKPYKVFPMSQYYVQNIEVPLTLHAGAVENGYMTVYVSYAGIQNSTVPFIGPNGMFNVKNGSITKDYDEAHDRLVIDVDGELEMKSLQISMKISLIGSTTIKSSEYVLPINGNITLNVNDGSKVNVTQSIALLPGSVINVNDGAECTFGSGVKAFIYDSEDWGGYCYKTNSKFILLKYAPGRQYTRTEDDLVDAEICVAGTIDASEAFVYTTVSGANIHGAEGGRVILKSDTTTTVTHQATQQGSDNTDIAYTQIPVIPAAPKNDDGTKLELLNCYLEYMHSDGVWNRVEAAATHTNKEITQAERAATCTEDGITEDSYCSACGTVISVPTVVPALGHEKVNHSAQDPTCDGIGWNAYETCTRCDYTTYEEIPALGHEKVSHEGKAATCEDTGWKAYETCTRCDYTTYEEIAALGHEKVSHEGKAATCEDTGWNAYETCTRCDYTTYEEIPALGHNKVNHPAQDPTCEGIGWNAYEACTRCDYTTYIEIPALGHTFEDLICTKCGCEQMATNTVYSVDNGNIVLDTSLLLDLEDSTYIITAAYDDSGRMLKVFLNTVASLEKITLPAENVSYVKIFAWSNSITFKPITFVEEIIFGMIK